MNPSIFQPIARFLLAAVAAVGLASCAVYDGAYYSDGGPPPYAGGGYYGGGGYAYDDWGQDYYGYYPPVYRSYVTYSAAWPYYYGGRYYSHRWWNDNRYRHYGYDYGSNRDRYRKRRSSEEMKLVRYRGPERGRLPTGYHSEQWYRDRGYSTKTNTYRERDGDLRGRQPSSSSSGSRSGSRPKADGRPTSEHPRAIRQPEKFRFVGSGSDERRESSSVRRPSSGSSNTSASTKSASSRNADTRSGRSSARTASSSATRATRDTRPTSEHPRALRQPEKYRHTGSSDEKRGSGKGKKD